LRAAAGSYHYAPAADYAEADPSWVALARRAAAEAGLEAIVGATWTTDAPFRETAGAIAAAKAKGMLAVEMEAAALYAFAHASGSAVLCLAHVTNTMGQTLHDFEKGARDGTQEALALLAAIVSHAGRHILNTAPAV
jgi:purine-nucleoside phosphorylase